MHGAFHGSFRLARRADLDDDAGAPTPQLIVMTCCIDRQRGELAAFRGFSYSAVI
jgi:hypothetical protein